MKKALAITALVVSGLFINKANAQMSIGASMGANFFTGATKFGFTLNGKYAIKENIVAGLNLGYAPLLSLDQSVGNITNKSSVSIIPISGLFEYHFGGEKIKPYVGADAGFYAWRSSSTYGTVTNSTTKSYLGFAPVAGALYSVNDNISLCANFKYNVILTTAASTTYSSLNVGLVYNLK